jgi:hypothetical protein
MIPGKGLSDFITILLSVSSFLFGIFVAFSISDRHSRLKELREELKATEAFVVDIYKLSSVFGEKTQKECQRLLDDWVVATIDHYLEDYHKATPQFLKLYEFLISLTPKTKKQEMAYEQLLITAEQMNKSNKKIRYLATDRMSGFEWWTILLLAGIILFCLFYINTNTLVSIIIVVLLSLTLSIFTLILRDLNTLFWKEQTWIWDPLIDLFRDIGMLPYFSEADVKSKRVKVPKGTIYRSAKFPHPYPDITDKTVEIVNG